MTARLGVVYAIHLMQLSAIKCMRPYDSLGVSPDCEALFRTIVRCS